MKHSLTIVVAAALYVQAAQNIFAQATNSPPTVACPTNTTAQCAALTSLSASVADADGDDLTVVWSVNGAVVQTDSVAGSNALAGASVSLSAKLSAGTNVVMLTATDSATNSASCTSTIDVVDTTPPVIHSVSASPNILWPPNHQMVSVQIHADVSDTCGSATWKITKVTSNETVDSKGSGHTSADWQITGNHTLKLRAERSGKGHGRVYTITIQATDQAGNTAQSTVTVSVPHNATRKK